MGLKTRVVGFLLSVVVLGAGLAASGLVARSSAAVVPPKPTPTTTTTVSYEPPHVFYCVNTNIWQDRPFVAESTNPDVIAAWNAFAPGIRSPYAVKLSSLSAAAKAHFPEVVGMAWALVCNLDIGWTPGVKPTGKYLDNNGWPDPAMPDWLNGGVPIPGVYTEAA